MPSDTSAGTMDEENHNIWHIEPKIGGQLLAYCCSLIPRCSVLSMPVNEASTAVLAASCVTYPKFALTFVACCPYYSDKEAGTV